MDNDSQLEKISDSENDHSVYKTFRTTCRCASHSQNIDLEYDKKLDMFSLTFYNKLEWSSYWGDLRLHQRIWKRIKASCKILFTGYIEMESEFIFRDKDQLLSISDEIRKFVEENDKTNQNS